MSNREAESTAHIVIDKVVDLSAVEGHTKMAQAKALLKLDRVELRADDAVEMVDGARTDVRVSVNVLRANLSDSEIKQLKSLIEKAGVSMTVKSTVYLPGDLGQSSSSFTLYQRGD